MSSPGRFAENINFVPKHDENEFETVDFIEVIKECTVGELLERMTVSQYAASNCYEDVLIYSRCKQLFERDFLCETIENSTGCLSPNYPVRLIIPVGLKHSDKRLPLDSKYVPVKTDRYTIQFDPEEYREQVKRSYGSRCRSRFVVPAILYNGTFICRSGTLSVRKGAALESAMKADEPTVEVINEGILSMPDRLLRNIGNFATHTIACSTGAAVQFFVPDSMSRLKVEDSKLMKSLDIKYICDLMVEDRKIVSQISVGSSEKINMDIFADFNVEQMPYPGCEFFTTYAEADHNPTGLVFDWNAAEVNSVLKLSTEDLLSTSINWNKYKEWDIVELTRNYIEQILAYVHKGAGLLIHCISGWDRTPLFISIIRLSLWADDLIHSSLSALEMAYLTLAYDWFLFGHNLPSRLSKKEEIMHFCFKFLPFIAEDCYSLNRHGLKRDKETGQTDREQKLKSVSTLVLSLYKDTIVNKNESLPPMKQSS